MKNSVLIVDDMELNRDILREILEEDYPILEADSGKSAVEMMQKHNQDIAVVLLDLIMDDGDGFAVLEVMKKKNWLDKMAVLIISGETSLETEKKCFEYSISDFIHKPFDNTLVRHRVQNMAELFMYKNELEDRVEKQTEALRKQYRMLQIQAEKLKSNNVRIIDILGTVVESRNLESGEHIMRVKNYTDILARQVMMDYPEYGLDEAKVDIIVSASALHDIGKIAIPDNILLKPAKLTETEFEYMKSHTTRGCEILENIQGAWGQDYAKASYEICRHHHERYDGRGYPDGLEGDDIPISAQIVSIADVYDALVNERVYKSAYSKEQAFHMIVTGECGIFSPKLLECFRKVRKQFEQLATQKELEEAEE